MIQKIFSGIRQLIQPKEESRDIIWHDYEYCPRCEANLTLQKGYNDRLPYWKCLGCGEMLINPENEADSKIVWLCDDCEQLLNIQPGFSETCGEWKCVECGFVNKINAQEVYASDEDYRREISNPYRGMCDEDLLRLSAYEELGYLHNFESITLVRDRETGETYIKKHLSTYDKSIYEYLIDHPIWHMPKIISLFEGSNTLIVIEELVQGYTVEELLGRDTLKTDQAIRIVIELSAILDELHNLEKPIVHRDVKPSNVMITPNGETWLLDVNVAKWHDPDEKDDTRHMGTWNYAAPEQVGYGLKASSPQTDIYALGILLNVMITGKFPKEEQAKGKIWGIIQKCISLNAEERYTAKELKEALSQIRKD